MKKTTLLSLIFICFVLTGCGNIKFIEKVEPEVKNEQTSEQFGDIIIEESTSGKKETNEAKTEETHLSEEPGTITESEELSESEESGFIYEGVKFIMDGQNATMWVSQDCPIKQKPIDSARDSGMLHRGDVVTLKSISSDETWAMVSVYGGPSMYVHYNCLSYEEITISVGVSELQTQSSQAEELSEQLSETTSVQSETQSEQQPEQSSVSDRPSTEQSPEQPSHSEPSYSESEYTPEPEPEPEPVDTYQGISFPANASSTSFNMGVEFADVTVTLTVRKDNVLISNGPAAPSNSSGYYTMASLSSGTTIKCTGIGRNGFVRVEYNGEIGFIDSRNVEY